MASSTNSQLSAYDRISGTHRLGIANPTVGAILLGYAVVPVGALAFVTCVRAWEGERTFPDRAIVTRLGEPRSDVEVDEGIHLGAWLISAVIVLCVFAAIYAEFARHIYIVAGGFEAPGTGVWQWLLFGATDMADSLSFGLFSIWIDPTVRPTTWWAKTLIVAPYHLLLVTIVVTDFLHGLQRFRANS
jgi:hypothetical protein